MSRIDLRWAAGHLDYLFCHPHLAGLMHGRIQASSLAENIKGGRFLALDGLRGVAALVVVWFHISVFGWVRAPQLATLAVDLFFILSGFVLAYANDKRFEAGETAGSFMLKRAIRLWPLYLAGYLLGLGGVLSIVRQGGSHNYAALELVTNLFLIPTPSIHNSYFQVIPVDGPAWSLVLEFWVANLVYALFWKQLRGLVLAGVIGTSAIALVYLQFKSHALFEGSQLSQIPQGVARVIFSFFVGVLIARVHKARRPKLHVPSSMIYVTLALLLFVPATGLLGRFVELSYVFLVFPALIYWGAETRETFPLVGRLLGDTSYAIYVIHTPLIYGANWLVHRLEIRPGYAIASVLLALLVMLSYTLAKLDIWVRPSFTKLLLGSPKTQRVGLSV